MEQPDPVALCEQLVAQIRDAGFTTDHRFPIKVHELDADGLTGSFLETWQGVAASIEKGRKSDSYMLLGSLLAIGGEMSKRLAAQTSEG